ncbi:Crp/Fnr family transcriptional regulator [Lentibacillus saliphilus]|uniref:Crp/Fnr family transcriptional regulator n=1 Tax=Lentibacillus saliphilus TaxID=2737028 RepID=UPI001C2F792E|nr:Crp/Fnr family transcriptional regulator [Lentibacillus saliphilus]
MRFDRQEFKIFSSIPEDEMTKIQPLLTERKFKKNHILFFENDTNDNVYIIKSGLAKVCRYFEDKEIVLGIATTGEILGEMEILSFHSDQISSVEAMTDLHTWRISKQDFSKIIDQYPSVLKHMYSVLTERVRSLNRLIRYLSFLDVRTKVANLLIDFYYNIGEQEGDTYSINLKLNQTLLANMLGVTRESVSKTLSEFQDEGLIDMHHKTYQILDLEGLKALCVETEDNPELRLWFH